MGVYQSRLINKLIIQRTFCHVPLYVFMEILKYAVGCLRFQKCSLLVHRIPCMRRYQFFSLEILKQWNALICLVLPDGM